MKVKITHCHYHTYKLTWKISWKCKNWKLWLIIKLVFFSSSYNVHNSTFNLLLTTSDLSCYLQKIHMMKRKEKGLTETAATACSHQHKICIRFLMRMCLTYRVRLSSSFSSIVSRAFCVQSTFSQNKTLMSERRQCRYWASKTKEAKLRHQRKESKNMKSRTRSINYRRIFFKLTKNKYLGECFQLTEFLFSFSLSLSS